MNLAPVDCSVDQGMTPFCVKEELTLGIEAEAGDVYAESEVNVVRDNVRQLMLKSELICFEE